jgi:hypothetical protein
MIWLKWEIFVHRFTLFVTIYLLNWNEGIQELTDSSRRVSIKIGWRRSKSTFKNLAFRKAEIQIASSCVELISKVLVSLGNPVKRS